MPDKHPQPRAGEAPKFSLGRTVATSGAIAELSHHDTLRALSRHVKGDWGDVCEEDWKANDEALKDDTRLVSVYHSESGVKFYVITEWDRSLTTILLPQEY